MSVTVKKWILQETGGGGGRAEGPVGLRHLTQGRLRPLRVSDQHHISIT